VTINMQLLLAKNWLSYLISIYACCLYINVWLICHYLVNKVVCVLWLCHFNLYKCNNNNNNNNIIIIIIIIIIFQLPSVVKIPRVKSKDFIIIIILLLLLSSKAQMSDASLQFSTIN